MLTCLHDGGHLQGAGGQCGLGAVAVSLQSGHRGDEMGLVPAVLPSEVKKER